MKINEESLKKLSNIIWKLDPNCPDEPQPDEPNEYYQGVRDLLDFLLDED